MRRSGDTQRPITHAGGMELQSRAASSLHFTLCSRSSGNLRLPIVRFERELRVSFRR